MKVIMIYKKYHDMEIREIFPEIFRIKENDKPEEVLRKIWEDGYNGAIADNINSDFNDPIDEKNCWFEEDMAVITWEDGDAIEYYVVDVQEEDAMKTIEEQRQAARNTNELANHLRRIIEQNNDRYSFEWLVGGEHATMKIFDKEKGIGYAVKIEPIEYDENGEAVNL